MRLQTIKTLRQLKALADPLRYRIFEHLTVEPRTAKQLAVTMGTHPTRLYHHFRVLERAGLIRSAGTRRKRGTVEKYFQAAAERIVLAPDILGGKAALGRSLFAGVLRATLADLETAARSGPPGGRGPTLLLRRRIGTAPEYAREIRHRIEQLIELCDEASRVKGETDCGLTVAFHEVARGRRGRKKK